MSGTEDTIILKGVKDAIEKVIQLAELIRHRIKGLHQIITITTTEFVDEYEPLEEGLDKLVFTRKEPSIEIVISKKELDTTNSGYSEPLPDSEVSDY